MYRYYYNELTGEINTKYTSTGGWQLITHDPYIETAQDIDISQYTVDIVNSVLLYTPKAKPVNPRSNF